MLLAILRLLGIVVSALAFGYVSVKVSGLKFSKLTSTVKNIARNINCQRYKTERVKDRANNLNIGVNCSLKDTVKIRVDDPNPIQDGKQKNETGCKKRTLDLIPEDISKNAFDASFHANDSTMPQGNEQPKQNFTI
jgi:hypothetical protein